MPDNNDGHYEALWPRSARRIDARTLAPRLDTLAGKTVVELWDRVYRGDEIFDWLEQGLKSCFPTVRFVNWREFGTIHGSSERAVVADLPRRLKEVGAHAVIAGIGA